MNAVDFLEYEDMDAYDDSDESVDDSFDENDGEARRSKRRRPVAVARGSGYTVPRMARGYVTQTQLQAGLNRVGNDIRRNSAAIRTVGKRLDSASAKQDKEATELRGDLKRSRDMAMLMPFLMKPKVINTPVALKVDDGAGNMVEVIPKDTKIHVDSTDSMSMLMPILLLSGGFGGSDDGKGGGDNMMMMLLLLMFMK